LEFANHFSEWCYNYHDSVAPHLCRVDRYPTLEQQKTFLKAYVEHSVHGPASGTQTPKTTPAVGAGGVSGISAFMLDSRTPSRHSATGLVHVENMGSNAEDAERDRVYKEEEERRARETEEKVKKLLWETRLWRVANSAQWVAWGIVQASVPGLEEEESEGVKEKSEEPEQRLQSPPHTNTADHAFGRPETLVAQAMLSGDKDALSEAIEEEKLEQAAEAEAEAAKAESEAAEAAGSEGEHDDAEVEFDYLAYAQERAMFFWGDCIGLGLTSWEELEGWAKEGAGSRGMEGWEEFKKGIVVLDY
jgi:choline kinase